MKALLTVDQLSQYLHKSVASIRSKRLLWRVEDVENWLAEHVEGVAPPQRPTVAFDDHKPRRGRPTKAEQLARQRQLQASATGRGVSSSARA